LRGVVVSAGDELVVALGLEGAVVIDHDEYAKLPEHRRSAVTSSGGRGYAYLRLPDPPPVAALRLIAELLDGGMPERRAEDVRDIARDALAAWDGMVAS
jgi:hypothetical protein